jgi:hypothetical protein
MQGFWKDAHDEGGLAWDDSNNNRAFLSGTICATSNAASIYIESLRKADQYKTEKGTPLKDDIQPLTSVSNSGRGVPAAAGWRGIRRAQYRRRASRRGQRRRPLRIR